MHFSAVMLRMLLTGFEKAANPGWSLLEGLLDLPHAKKRSTNREGNDMSCTGVICPPGVSICESAVSVGGRILIILVQS